MVSGPACCSSRVRNPTPRTDRAGDPGLAAKAAAAGIGLLLTFIGLRNAGLIVGDTATLVRMGTLDHRAAFLVLASSSRRC